MGRQDAPARNPLLRAVRESGCGDGFEAVRLETARGDVDCRLNPVPSPRAAIFVGGAGGGWDSPARGLYARLCAELPDEGVSALRLRFRDPAELPEAEFDLLAAVEYLQRRHASAVALVGHSFGAAAVIRAAARCSAARTVVALAAQSYGAEGVESLGPGCSLLLVHGLEDRTLSPTCSAHLHERAREPRRLVLVHAGHGLDEAAEDVHRVVAGWLLAELLKAEPPSPQSPGP